MDIIQFLSSFFLSLLLYNLYDHFPPIYEDLKTKTIYYHTRFKSLESLVRSNNKGLIYPYWVCFVIIMKSLYLKFLQFFQRTVVQKDKNLFEVTYTINETTYKMLVKVKKGPKLFLSAVDENNLDISEIIKEYAGPLEDFHGSKLTPQFFNKKEITIKSVFNDTKTFKDYEVIVIN